MLTPEQLRAICERAELATPGPWFAKATDDELAMNARYVSTVPGEFRHDQKRTMTPEECDAETVVAITLLQYPPLAVVEDGRWDENTEFIAHARTDIPALLSHIDELVSLLREARWLIDSYDPWVRSSKYAKLLDEIDTAIAIHDAAQKQVEGGDE